MKTGERNSTRANRGNGERKVNLCSLRSLLLKSVPGGVVELDFDKTISDGVNIYAKRDGDADFVFLACRAGVGRRRARDTAPAAPKSDEGWSPYIDNVARRHRTRTARIQSRLCPERRPDWLVQR